MKRVWRQCLLSFGAILGVFVTMLSQAVAQVPTSQADEKWIAAAAPYVGASLNKPVDALYASGIKAAPYDMMTFGFALLAGRSTDGNFSEDDRAALLRLEERVAPAVEAYKDKHPDKNIMRVNWHRKLKITEAEKALVARYQAAYLPDYWLGGALVAVKTTSLTKHYRPTTSDIGRGLAPGVSMTSDVYYDRIIPLEVTFTGAQCVAALRKEAGLSLQPLHEHPISVLVIRHYKSFDIEAVLAEQISTGKGKGPVGKAACGTVQQFDSYVGQLKAVQRQ